MIATKKSFGIFGIAIMTIGLLFAGCNKNEEDTNDSGANSEPADHMDFSVSQKPTTKTVLIEEFTGNRCINCPDGHKVANQVKSALGDKCCIINYHINSSAYADNYVTVDGNSFNTIFNVDTNDYYHVPAAMINRTKFTDESVRELTVYKNEYQNCANQIASQNACVNVAARAVINRNTRMLSVRVQTYYTGDGNGDSHLLNIAIIQNNVLGSQTGMNYNPDYVQNGQYRHMAMFREFVTGQWGETISPVTQGSMTDKTYMWPIQNYYTDPYNNKSTACDLDNLQVVVFITEADHKNVVNACMAPIKIK